MVGDLRRSAVEHALKRQVAVTNQTIIAAEANSGAAQRIWSCRRDRRCFPRLSAVLLAYSNSENFADHARKRRSSGRPAALRRPAARHTGSTNNRDDRTGTTRAGRRCGFRNSSTGTSTERRRKLEHKSRLINEFSLPFDSSYTVDLWHQDSQHDCRQRLYGSGERGRYQDGLTRRLRPTGDTIIFRFGALDAQAQILDETVGHRIAKVVEADADICSRQESTPNRKSRRRKHRWIPR